MREQPDAAELIAAVAAFLRDEAMPALDGRLAFHARVAANVLDIVGRELALGPAAEAREGARLASLVGDGSDPAAASAALCAAIRAGTIPFDDPSLVAHLWSTTLDTLAIDQPRYETYRRAAAIAAGKNGEE
jgi:hypothetical protein